MSNVVQGMLKEEVRRFCSSFDIRYSIFDIRVGTMWMRTIRKRGCTIVIPLSLCLLGDRRQTSDFCSEGGNP